MSFATPVLLIIFNRKDNTQKVFDQIKKVKPKHFFIAADGPRTNRPEDVQKCAETRQIIEQIDWDCELKTLFRDENRGCGYGPAEAITWFFENVEEGIILEDDCVPSISFFFFSEKLLKTYKNDVAIFMIGGSNAATIWRTQRSNYFYSHMGISYGWASWRRAWQTFDYEIKAWKTTEGINNIREHLNNKFYFEVFSREFDKISIETPSDIWDFQWLFARWLNKGKTIIPSVNLVTNIGFNANATHTFNENHQLANLPLMEIEGNLKSYQKLDKLYDWYVFERFINPNPMTLFKRILLKSIRLYFGLP